MTNKTIDFYNQNATELAHLYDHADVKALHQALLKWLPNEARVLEVGCGSGRDARFLAQNNFKVTATDASLSMIKAAEAKECLGHKIDYQNITFPLSEVHPFLKEDAQKFDAVVSIAFLMHLEKDQLFSFLFQVKRLLKEGGIFFCSYCTKHDQSDERLYVEHDPDALRLFVERLGFVCLNATSTHSDGLKRDITWTTMVFRLKQTAEQHSIKQINAIINTDRKVTTYKFALLRAIAEMSQSSTHIESWLPHGRVGVPFGLVVWQWFLYYWPILGNRPELPETSVSSRVQGLKFKPDFIKLFSCVNSNYKIMDSMALLNTFLYQFERSALNDEQDRAFRRLLNQISSAIIEGPILHSGNSLNQEEVIFEHTGAKTLKHSSTFMDITHGLGLLTMPASLWKEFTLSGFWIHDALVLKWADLSQSFAKTSGISKAQIVEILLQKPDAERKVGLARKIYNEMSDLRCVWTSQPIKTSALDVDHIIPFSFWHANDLWNLVPAKNSVNRSKSDKLVDHQLLVEQKDLIVHSWDQLYGEYPALFEEQANYRLMNRTFNRANWQNPLFDRLVETVELVAEQYQPGRWSPKTCNR